MPVVVSSVPSIRVTLLGIVTAISLLHPEKAPASTCMMLPGIA